MNSLSIIALTVASSSVCLGAELPRSSPEAQGVSSAAILSFIEAADSNIDSLHSFMLLRHGHVVAEGWWSPYDPQSPHSLYSLSKSFTSTAVGLAIAEGKLSLDDEVLKFFPDECARGPEQQPQGDASQRPAPHVHGPADRAAPSGGSALDQGVPGPSRPLQARDAFPLQHLGDVHALGHRPEGDGADRSRLSAAATVRAAGHRAPDLGNQPARHQRRRFRLEHSHRGHRPLRPALPAEGPSGRASSLCPRPGSRRPPPARPPTAAARTATGTRATATSSGAAATTSIAATAPSASTAS